MNRGIMFTAGIVVVLSGFLLAKSLSQAQDPAKPGAKATETNQSTDSKPKDGPAEQPAPPTPGSVAPDFTLTDMDGKAVQLSSFRGKAVLVNFWATWCEPCKIEMPWFVDLQKKYGPQGLQILGVAMDDADDKTISGFARKMGVNYPVLKGTEKVADIYGGLDSLPATFFVDRSGKVVQEAVGLISESVIEDAIKESLEQSKEPKSERPE